MLRCKFNAFFKDDFTDLVAINVSIIFGQYFEFLTKVPQWEISSRSEFINHVTDFLVNAPLTLTQLRATLDLPNYRFSTLILIIIL